MLEDLLNLFPSDKLEELRHLLCWAQSQIPSLKLPPRIFLIPDTNCILKEIDYNCRRRQKPGRSALEEVVDSGLVRLFGPTELKIEVVEKLILFAEARGGDPNRYMQEWERYQQKIHFLQVDPNEPVEISDQDDACFVRALRAVGANAIITDDNVVLGAAPSVKPPIVQHSVRTISRDEAKKLGLSSISAFALLLAGDGLKALVRSASKKPRFSLAIVSALGLALYQLDKKQVANSGTSVLRELAQKAADGIGVMFETFASRQVSVTEHRNLFNSAIGAPLTRTMEQAIHAALIAAAKPLSENEVVSTVRMDGFDPWANWPQQPDELQADWTRRAWSEYRHQVCSLLRSNAQYFWTGTGWASRLIPTVAPVLPPVAPAPVRGHAEKAEKLSPDRREIRPSPLSIKAAGVSKKARPRKPGKRKQKLSIPKQQGRPSRRQVAKR